MNLTQRHHQAPALASLLERIGHIPPVEAEKRIVPPLEIRRWQLELPGLKLSKKLGAVHKPIYIDVIHSSHFKLLGYKTINFMVIHALIMIFHDDFIN
jgi:hypothetical protein